MTMSATLNSLLNQRRAQFDLVPHPRTGSSMETAEVAHVPGERLAKAVIVKENDVFQMVVVPSTWYVDINKLREQLGTDVELAAESEITQLFPDCAPGAIPPVGTAYGIATFWDECLADQPEIFFEAGDHEELVRMSPEQFTDLMADATRGHFGHSM